LEVTGQADSEGNRLVANTETSGRKHSNWLSMMYPRLVLARNLLTEDGIILISISDIEHSNLRLLCDEIFGSYNFVANFVWLNQEGGGGSDSSLVRTKHEYVLCYARDVSKLLVNGLDVENQDSYTFTDEYADERGPHKLIKLNSFSIQYSASLDYQITGPDGEAIVPSENGKRGCWRWSKQKLEWGIQNGFVVFKNGADGQMRVYTKQYLHVDNENIRIERKQPPLAVIKDYSSTMATKELEKILGPGIFDYSKPYQLISHFVKIFSNPGDVILDFFAGSATIGQAVTSLNSALETPRRYIAVTLDEETPEDSRARKSGYLNIPDISRERLRKSSLNGQGFRSFKLSKSSFLGVDSIDAVGDLFAETLSDAASNDEIAAECFLKNGILLDERWETMTLNSENIQVCGGVAVCLSRAISTELSDQILKLQGIHTAIFLEDGFKTDSVKVDTFFSFKQANKTMKTI
jgi:adenine-specific DNA-methyltransferase